MAGKLWTRLKGLNCIYQLLRKRALICVIHPKKILNFLKNFFLLHWRLMWKTPGVNSLPKYWLRHKSSMDTHRPGIPEGPGTPMVPLVLLPVSGQLSLLRSPLHLQLPGPVQEAVEEVHQAEAVEAAEVAGGNRYPNFQNSLIILNRYLNQTDITTFCKTVVFSICMTYL